MKTVWMTAASILALMVGYARADLIIEPTANFSGIISHLETSDYSPAFVGLPVTPFDPSLGTVESMSVLFSGVFEGSFRFSMMAQIVSKLLR